MPKRKPKPAPKKRILHKLTDKVKNKIKETGKAKLSDYTGEALTYAKKYNALAKARKAKAGKVFKIDDFDVPRNSELYSIAEKLAQQKNTTVAKLSKKDKEAIAQLGKDGRLFFNREFEYIKKDIENANTVSINGKAVDKKTAKMRIVRLKNAASANAGIYNYLNIEHYYDLKGNLNLSLPESREYRAFSFLDEEERKDKWRDLLDKYEIGYTPND